MKTGVAIALALGVPATIGIIAWAIMANKIVDAGTSEIPVPGGGIPPKPTPDPVIPGTKLPTPPAPIEFMLTPDGKGQGIIIRDMRSLHSWVRAEVARRKIPGTRRAATVIAELLTEIPRDRTIPIVAIVLEQTGEDDEFSDVMTKLGTMTVTEALAKSDLAIKEQGL